MNRDLRNILIGAGTASIILLFFFLRGCGGDTSKEGRSSNRVDTVIHYKDTFTKTIIDTFLDTISITKYSEPDTVVVYKDSSKSYHTVETSYKDSLLRAKVSTDLKGEFVGQSLNYSILSPREKMIRTDSVIIRDSIHTERTITKDPWRFGFGAEIEGSKNYFDFAPAISLEKDGVQIKYEYNVLNKTHEIGLQKKIDLN